MNRYLKVCSLVLLIGVFQACAVYRPMPLDRAAVAERLSAGMDVIRAERLVDSTICRTAVYGPVRTVV